jgi:hypothetical protein
MAAERPRVGSRIINDAGTCLKVQNISEGETIPPGVVPANRLDEFLAAGYRSVTKEDIIPVQAHQIEAEYLHESSPSVAARHLGSEEDETPADE